MAEKRYLKKGSTVVTDRKAVIGGKHYRIADLRSVSVKSVRPGLAKPVIMAVLGVAVCYGSYRLLMATIESVGRDESAYGLIVANVLIFPIAIAFVIATVNEFRNRIRTFVLELETRDGPVSALENESEDLVRELHGAITQAIADKTGRSVPADGKV